jgi:hypothetical protein
MAPVDAERNTLLHYLDSTRETLTERDVTEVIVVPAASSPRPRAAASCGCPVSRSTTLATTPARANC